MTVKLLLSDDPTPILRHFCFNYFQPIIELFALERGFFILTHVTYPSENTAAQYWPHNKTISFREGVTKDSAIHELCHHAEKRTGIIRHVNNAA